MCIFCAIFEQTTLTFLTFVNIFKHSFGTKLKQSRKIEENCGKLKEIENTCETLGINHLFSGDFFRTDKTMNL